MKNPDTLDLITAGRPYPSTRGVTCHAEAVVFLNDRRAWWLEVAEAHAASAEFVMLGGCDPAHFIARSRESLAAAEALVIA